MQASISAWIADICLLKCTCQLLLKILVYYQRLSFLSLDPLYTGLLFIHMVTMFILRLSHKCSTHFDEEILREPALLLVNYLMKMDETMIQIIACSFCADTPVTERGFAHLIMIKSFLNALPLQIFGALPLSLDFFNMIFHR